MKHSVLIIKSVNDDSTNSCCSGSGEEGGEVEGSITDIESLNFKTFYDNLKNTYSSKAEFHILDPRNSFLIFILIKDCLRFKMSISAILKTVFTFAVPSIIINGKVAFKSIPTSEDFKSYIETLDN